MIGVVARFRQRLGEIRPAPAPGRIARRAIYGYGLVGVAALVGLAWVNNAQRVASAFLVALVLGVLWVAYMAHRRVLTTALAIVWWIVTAPMVGVLASLGQPLPDVQFAISRATTTDVGLGVVVWLGAVLARAPRPATTIMTCWLLNLVVMVAVSFLTPAYGWLVGYAVTVIVLAQRTGLLARLRSRTARGLVLSDPADPADQAVRAALDGLPPTLAVRSAAPAGGQPGATLVVGPTGTYAIVGLVTEEPIRTVGNGTRLAAGRRRLDADLRTAARAAARTQERVRTPVHPVLLVAGGDFPDGICRVRVRPTAQAQPAEVLVLRRDLASGRLAHGSPVLTAGQVARILRRLDALPAHPE